MTFFRQLDRDWFFGPERSGIACDPWAAIHDFTLVIIKGVATAEGHTRDPGAKREVIRRIARAPGVTSVRDHIALLGRLTPVAAPPPSAHHHVTGEPIVHAAAPH